MQLPCRDDCGVVRQRAVLDHSLDQTPQIVKKLAETVEDTKGELLQEIRKTNQLLESRLDSLENKTDLKVARLDQITKERINAERIKCLHRIDRRATLERSRSKKATGLPCGHSADEVESADCVRRSIYPGSSLGVGEDKTDAVMKCSDSDIANLHPYQTVKINREDVSGTRFCPSISSQTMERYNPATNTNHHLQCLNASDSAYGSLSPPTRADISLSCSQSQIPRLQECSNNTGRKSSGIHSLPKNTGKLDISNNDNDTNSRWQVGEEIRERMGDLYGRQSVKTSEKQTSELEQKVAQLALQVKILRTEVSKESP